MCPWLVLRGAQAEAFIESFDSHVTKKLRNKNNVNIERRGCANLHRKILPIKGSKQTHFLKKHGYTH